MDAKVKKCDSCGQILPVDRFQSWTNKNGEVKYLHHCYKCQRDKANKRFSDKKKFGELAKFDDEYIISEVKRRNIFILEHVDSVALIQELKSRRR